MTNNFPSGLKQPKIVTFLRWVLDPLKLLDECYEKIGDVFALEVIGFPPFIMLANPDWIQDIFNHDQKWFDAGSLNEITAPIIGDHSIMLMEGDKHKQERNLLMPPFHGERLQNYAQLIVNITHKNMKSLSINKTFQMRDLMKEITLEIMIQIIFGLNKTQERYQKIKKFLTYFLDLTASPLRFALLSIKSLQQDLGSWSPWGKLVQTRKKLYNLLQDEIKERRNNLGEKEDILSLLLSVKDEDGQPMTDIEICDELMTLLFAGHESSATTLSWAFYEIIRNPEIQEKLTRELSHLKEFSSVIEWSKLPYLTVIVQESLRLYPIIPATFTRISKKPVVIQGKTFPKNTYFTPSIYLVHHREDIYPHAKQFIPERFFDRTYSPAEYFPFGGGTRRCLGYAMALLEMKLILATILGHYQLKLLETETVVTVRRGLTLAPSTGIKMQFLGEI